MLTAAEARAHERKFLQLLIELVAIVALLVVGLIWVDVLFLLALTAAIVQQVRLSVYMLKDTHLRSSPAYWVVTPDGLFVWMLWRSWHSLPIKDAEVEPEQDWVKEEENYRRRFRSWRSDSR